MYEDDEQQDQTTAPSMRGVDPAAQRRTMMPGGFGGGPPQMPWHQQQQGQPNWGAILDRFRQRFAQHNPFLARMQGGAPGQMPQQAPPGAAPGAAPAMPPQGANPWADRIAAAAQRFGGNRQPGGIIPPRGQY